MSQYLPSFRTDIKQSPNQMLFYLVHIWTINMVWPVDKTFTNKQLKVTWCGYSLFSFFFISNLFCQTMWAPQMPNGFMYIIFWERGISNMRHAESILNNGQVTCNEHDLYVYNMFISNFIPIVNYFLQRNVFYFSFILLFPQDCLGKLVSISSVLAQRRLLDQYKSNCDQIYTLVWPLESC